MRLQFGLLLVCFACLSTLANAQEREFGAFVNVASQAVDNNEVFYNRPALRVKPDMATLSAAHILQHDLQPATAETQLLREQIKIELYRRHLFTDNNQRRQLFEPYVDRMELEVASSLADSPGWLTEEAQTKLGELRGRLFQLLNEGIQNTLAATGGPTQMGAISSTSMNAPLRLSMVPARQFEITTASSWLLKRAIDGESDYGWATMRNDQEVQLQGVYTIRVKRNGWYDYYKLTLGSGQPKFEYRSPTSLAPEIVLQPFDTIERIADQIVKDELVELFKPKFEFRDQPNRGFVYDLGNSMLETQGPSLNFQAFESLVRVAMIRRFRVNTPSRRAFWNPILDRVTWVLREEIEYLRQHGEMTQEKRDEFRDRVDAIYGNELSAYAQRNGYTAYRTAVKSAKLFQVLFETEGTKRKRLYYIPASAKMYADILRRAIPDYKWRPAYTGKRFQLAAGNYYWSTAREIDTAELFDENYDTISVD